MNRNLNPISIFPIYIYIYILFYILNKGKFENFYFSLILVQPFVFFFFINNEEPSLNR